MKWRTFIKTTGALGPSAAVPWDGSATYAKERRHDERELPWTSTGPALKVWPRLKPVNSIPLTIQALRPPITNRKRTIGLSKSNSNATSFNLTGFFLLDNGSERSYGCFDFLLLARWICVSEFSFVSV